MGSFQRQRDTCRHGQRTPPHSDRMCLLNGCLSTSKQEAGREGEVLPAIAQVYRSAGHRSLVEASGNAACSAVIVIFLTCKKFVL